MHKQPQKRQLILKNRIWNTCSHILYAIQHRLFLIYPKWNIVTKIFSFFLCVTLFLCVLFLWIKLQFVNRRWHFGAIYSTIIIQMLFILFGSIRFYKLCCFVDLVSRSGYQCKTNFFFMRLLFLVFVLNSFIQI